MTPVVRGAAISTAAIIFAVGGSWATAQVTLGSKLDTSRFVLDSVNTTAYRRAQTVREARRDSVVFEIASDVRALVCDRYPRQPRCLR